MYEALELCPELHILTCEFDKYQKVADQIYDIFFEFTNKIQVCYISFEIFFNFYL